LDKQLSILSRVEIFLLFVTSAMTIERNPQGVKGSEFEEERLSAYNARWFSSTFSACLYSVMWFLGWRVCVYLAGLNFLLSTEPDDP
jgi:hypothetical protein